MTTSTSTNHLDKSEENNDKIKEINIIPEIDFGRKTIVRYSNNELFENIREDDENYYKFKDYKEDDGFNL